MTNISFKKVSNPFTATIFLVTAGIVFATSFAHSAALPPAPEPTPTTAPSAPTTSYQSSGQKSESEERVRYSVCFYSLPNYRGDSICRSAPSRAGVFGRKIGNSVGSIKIRNSLGQNVKSPAIKLKICESIWRRGTCVVLNGSQNDLSLKLSNPVRSYAFDVRS